MHHVQSRSQEYVEWIFQIISLWLLIYLCLVDTGKTSTDPCLVQCTFVVFFLTFWTSSKRKVQTFTTSTTEASGWYAACPRQGVAIWFPESHSLTQALILPPHAFNPSFALPFLLVFCGYTHNTHFHPCQYRAWEGKSCLFRCAEIQMREFLSSWWNCHWVCKASTQKTGILSKLNHVSTFSFVYPSFIFCLFLIEV